MIFVLQFRQKKCLQINLKQKQANYFERRTHRQQHCDSESLLLVSAAFRAVTLSSFLRRAAGSLWAASDFHRRDRSLSGQLCLEALVAVA